MFRIDYTVHEDDNNFAIAQRFTHTETVARVADLLADTDNVREVHVAATDDKPAVLNGDAATGALAMVINAFYARRDTSTGTEEWDDQLGDYADPPLAFAAAAYALPEDARPHRTTKGGGGSLWPVSVGSFDGDADRLDQLAKAGAFVLAEMERLMRAKARLEARQAADAAALSNWQARVARGDTV